MSILTEPMPEFVLVGGQPFQVVTDFRHWLEFETNIMDKSIHPTSLVDLSIDALYVNPPKNGPRERCAAALFNRLIWFYRCGRPEKAAPRSGGSAGVRAYDFEQDAPLIMAAFQQAYGIDLTTAKMHWWRFHALFEALPDSCRICKIMEYRTADASDMPDKTKAFYEKMQEKYRLDPVPYAGRLPTVEEHDAEFIARLRRGE